MHFGGTGDAGASAGQPGTLLLDPKNIIVSATLGVFPQFELIDPTPHAGDDFGDDVTVLNNGNVVVAEESDDFGGINAGAVHLFNGVTGTLISSLVGEEFNFIGSGGVTALTNSNYVVSSPDWYLGGEFSEGAVTFADGATGVSGTVSSTNSLTGSQTNDEIGSGGVTALSNGNYVVSSPNRRIGFDVTSFAGGAVTFGSGTTGVKGSVSATNSLIGSAADQVGSGGVSVLANGNYVVSSPNWDNGATSDVGAVTFGDGMTGAVGVVSASNSLVGSTANDHVGDEGVTALTNGNYVVASSLWNNGATSDVGAVTFGNGTTGVVGVVSATNSLVGSTTNDQVGGDGVKVLTNSNYVVRSALWDNGTTSNAGAVTFGNGTTGIAGAVSAFNSLVGSTANDKAGSGGVTALSNGNYVVSSPLWNIGAITDAGAVTFGNGISGITGPITAGTIGNSLTGSHTSDQVGLNGVGALPNGNYVVRSPSWNNDTTNDVGAVTFGNGTTGITGNVSAANSLVGSSTNDSIGNAGVTVLTNGNYVVISADWDNGTAFDAGAVTFGSGVTGVVGIVSAANSLVGSHAGDEVGEDGVTALLNGNYVVKSSEWHNGAIFIAGAATFGNGTTDIVGVVSAANSLVGSSQGDFVGEDVIRLTNGNYVVLSSSWNDGVNFDVGAVTFGNGTTGIVGVVSASNSLVGSATDDAVGNGYVDALPNGNYVVASPDWNKGVTADVGAVTFGNGITGIVGAVSTANSLFGSTAGDFVGALEVTVLTNGNYVVNSPDWDNGTLDKAGAATWVNGTSGKTLDGNNAVNPQNSIVGQDQSLNGFSSNFASRENSATGTFLVQFSDEASGRGRVGFTDPNPNLLTFALAQAQTMTVTPAFLKRTLDTGTAVVLQASNDITINDAVLVNNPSGNGGAFTLQAGRSIFINHNIVTDDADLTLIATDFLANGVVNAQRDADAALIRSLGTLSAGTANITIQLRNGFGKTNKTSGDITLANVVANNVTIDNDGPSAGSDVSFSNITAPGTVTVTSNADVVLGNMSSTYLLNVNATRNIIDNSVATVFGQTTLRAGGDIVLDSGDHNFNRVVITDAVNVTLTDTNAIDLGRIVVSGNLNVTAAGAITDSGNITVGGTTTLATTEADNITLNNANNFNAVAIVMAFNALINDINGVTLNDSEVDNKVVLTAGGTITIAGTVTGKLVGGPGNDTFACLPNSTVTGTINGMNGTNTLDYSAFTTAVTVNLSTGAAANTGGITKFQNVIGGAGADTFTGNPQNNVLIGNGANDTLNGNDGDDSLIGNGGNDSLTANAGNDTLDGGDGTDKLIGGTGDDRYLFAAATASETDTFTEMSNGGNDTLDFSALSAAVGVTVVLTNDNSTATHANRTVKANATNQSKQIENVLGGAGNDNITGNDLGNILTGGEGNDTLVGSKGNDCYLFGTATAAQTDVVKELSGTDTGRDTLDFRSLLAGDPVTVDLSLDTGIATHTNRTINTQASGQAANFENAIGGAGNDTLKGNAGANAFVSGAGNDSLQGFGNRDLLIGGAGTDQLDGGDGDDLLIGGTTSHDTNVAAINLIMAEWTRTQTYSQRINHLTGAASGGSNGSVLLKGNTAAEPTVFDDAGTADALTGGPAADWFFQGLNDVLNDLNNGATETVTAI